MFEVKIDGVLYSTKDDYVGAFESLMNSHFSVHSFSTKQDIFFGYGDTTATIRRVK